MGVVGRKDEWWWEKKVLMLEVGCFIVNKGSVVRKDNGRKERKRNQKMYLRRAIIMKLVDQKMSDVWEKIHKVSTLKYQIKIEI